MKETKRVVISGCRDFYDYATAKEFIDFCISDLKEIYNIVIISGGARGADMLGERYAKEEGFALERYPAEWEKFGKIAGPIRNSQMAKLGDFFICFWDGVSPGTKNMIDLIKALDKPVRIKNV